jgi:HAD superfamily hydrolase (TIGR01509 family)
MRAERELVESFGGTWGEQQAYALVGSGLWNSASLLISAGVELEHEVIIDKLSARVREQISESVPWRPGARELMAEILQAGLPMALVTMSIGPNARAVSAALDRELGQKVFSAIISADDVERPKPDPEAYLAGAAAIGVDISDTLSFEDSSYGAASAFSAGSITIGIPLHVEIPQGSTHEQWESMAGTGLNDLREAFGRHRSAA